MNQASQRVAEQGDEPEPEVLGRGLTLREVVTATWTFRWSSLAIVAVTTGLAALIAFTATPIYRAEVLLSPLQDERSSGGGLSGIVRQLGDIAPLVGVNALGGGVGLKEETMALVKSRSFVIQFIRDERLMPVLYPEIAKRGKDAKDLPTYGDAYRRFVDSVLSIREDEDSGLIRLAIEWHDPQVGSQWANQLVQRINELMRARAIAEAQRSVEFLEKELTKTSILGIQDSIYRLIESHVGHIALASSRDGYAFRVIDPAVAPEVKDFVKPRRVLLIALGLVGGSLLAFFLVLLRLVWQRG